MERTEASIDSLYFRLRTTGIKPSLEVFSNGLRGYDALIQEGRLANVRYLTLIDFSLSSKERRLWVVDLENLTAVHHSLVAHGKNTGEEYALRFSNTPSSNMSSLGFFITGATYQGKHGFSLLLEGVEPGINDNARRRAIVFHPAWYATREFIDQHGRLGRSFGCPALPPAKSIDIIGTIKGRSCVFIYFPDQEYLSSSRYLKHLSAI